MVHSSALTAALAALLLALPSNAAGLYTKNSPVIQVDAKNYDRFIAQSNHTSLVEFYAPWCGHCKNLQPAFEKAAKNLAGLVKLAAVNCDDEENKQFCGMMGIQGFPTLKIIKPGKKSGSPMVEDYNGPRETKGIVDTMLGKIPNHVKRVTDKDLDAFLAEGNSTAKAVLFTEKGITSPLLKAISVDFLGSITVAQIRSKESAAVELFGITKFPSIVLLPGGPDAEGLVYDGEIKKDAIVAFLAQVAAPNPDPAPAKPKAPKSKAAKKTDKSAKESFESASSSHKESEGSSAAASATEEVLEDSSQPTESPEPAQDTKQKPIVVPETAAPITVLSTAEAFFDACLTEKSGTCVIAFVPRVHDEAATTVLTSLAEIAHRHKQAKRKIFPIYEVPDNIADGTMKSSMGWSGEVELVAINRKRGWFREYESKDLSEEAVEVWVDQIRMGEGPKKVLPGVILGDKGENTAEAAAEQPIEEAEKTETADEESIFEEESAEHIVLKHEEL